MDTACKLREEVGGARCYGPRMHWRRGLLLGALGLLFAAPPAAADEPLPAIAQYVEAIPTSSGPVRGARPATEVAKPQLSTTADSRLRRSGGSDEPALRVIVTEPALGAPQEALDRPLRSDELQNVRDALDAGSTPNADFVGSAAVGDGKRLPALVLVLLLLTPLLVVGGRRRAGRSPAGR